MIVLNNINSTIRRIDELGRIVIPKDARRKLKLKSNDPLELYIENDEIIIKKYSNLDNSKDFFVKLLDNIKRINNNDYIILDRFNIVATTNEELINNISKSEKNKILKFEELKNFETETNNLEGTCKKVIINSLPVIIDSNKDGFIVELSYDNKYDNNQVLKILKLIIEMRFEE